MEKSELLKIAKKHYEIDEVVRLEEAIDYATIKHDGQFRKSGEKYITHPLRVAGILIKWGMDIDSVIAGVLHDVVEDTETPLADIEEKFGKNVAFLVDGVTKVGRARSGMDNLEAYLPQTKDNLSKLLIAVGQDIRVIIIKLADRLHNVQTLEYMPPEKQKKIARESLDVFARIADRLGMGRVRMEIEEIAFSYLRPKEYNRLKNEMRKRLGKSTRKLGRVREDVENQLKKAGIDFKISGRVKSIYSLHKKLAKYNQNIDEVYDLTALRIIVEDVTDCYLTLGIIHALYTPMTGRIKDYVAMPKQNGYQSLHTTVITKDKRIVEFQIRTKDMHEYAERGLAASFFYNEQKLTENYKMGKIQHLPTNLLWISELQMAAAQLKEGKQVDMKKLKINLFADKLFVYTPKGDIIDLPVGSMPLDFAYRLHSEVGGHVIGAKINGKLSNLNTKLKNGDVVEILTSKNQMVKPSWLDKIITPHARNKIKQQLNHTIQMVMGGETKKTETGKKMDDAKKSEVVKKSETKQKSDVNKK